MNENKSNASTFRASKGTPKEGQITTNYWKGEKETSCIYHRSHQCEKVKTLADRKKIIATKKLCYNCTGTGHRAADSKSKRNSQNCGEHHHSSICGRNSKAYPKHSTAAVLATTEMNVVYPTVLVQLMESLASICLIRAQKVHTHQQH